MDREEAIEKLKSQRNVTCNGCLHAVGWCESHCKLSEAIDMAIEALKQPEPKEELLDDGTLVLWTSCDMTKVSRVNVRQTGTHYGDLYYPDED